MSYTCKQIFTYLFHSLELKELTVHVPVLCVTIRIYYLHKIIEYVIRWLSSERWILCLGHRVYFQVY